MGDGDERKVGGKIREFLQLPPWLPTQAGPGFKSRNKQNLTWLFGSKNG